MNFTNQYSSIYTRALGADSVTLGAMSSVSSVVSTVIALPAGWVSDRYDLKKVYGIGLLIQLVWICLYAFAQDWTWILVAMLISPFTMALMMRSQTIMISKGLKNEDRAQGFALRSVLSQVLGIIAPIPAAFLIEYFSGENEALSVEGIRPLYFIRLAGIALIALYVYSRLQSVPAERRPKGSSFIRDFRDVFKEGKGLYAWIFQSALGSIIIGLYMSFTWIYAKDHGADALTLSLMTTASTLATIIFSLPMSRLADTKGRRFAALISRPARYMWMLIFVFAPDPRWFIVAYFFRGVSMSSNAFQTWSLELVPPEKRGRWLGVTNMINAIVRIPAPIIGGILYRDINPDLVFLIPVALGLFLRVPILALKVPETLKNDSSM
jgi:MFS family permease